MLKKIRLKDFWPNSLFCTLILIAVPSLLFYQAYYYYTEISELNKVEQYLIAMQSKIMKYNLVKERETSFFNQIEVADPNFIQKQLEPIVFLDPEIKKLQALSSYVKEDEELDHRLLFLKNENHLRFLEKDFRQDSKIKETEYQIAKPLQLDKENLKQLLSLIENRKVDSFTPPPGSPQITIKEFYLEKKEIAKDSEVFEVSMSIIKREKI